MRKLLIAGVATLSLAGAAFAQSVPPGSSQPEYGTHAFPNAQYENQTVFSKLFGGHKSNADEKTVNDTSTSTPRNNGS